MTFQPGYNLSYQFWLPKFPTKFPFLSNGFIHLEETKALPIFDCSTSCFSRLKSMQITLFLYSNPELWIQLKSHLVHKLFMTSQQEGIFPLIKVLWHMIFVTFLAIKYLSKGPSRKLFKSYYFLIVMFMSLFYNRTKGYLEIRHALCPALHLACRR